MHATSDAAYNELRSKYDWNSPVPPKGYQYGVGRGAKAIRRFGNSGLLDKSATGYVDMEFLRVTDEVDRYRSEKSRRKRTREDEGQAAGPSSVQRPNDADAATANDIALLAQFSAPAERFVTTNSKTDQLDVIEAMSAPESRVDLPTLELCFDPTKRNNQAEIDASTLQRLREHGDESEQATWISRFRLEKKEGRGKSALTCLKRGCEVTGAKGKDIWLEMVAEVPAAEKVAVLREAVRVCPPSDSEELWLRLVELSEETERPPILQSACEAVPTSDILVKARLATLASTEQKRSFINGLIKQKGKELGNMAFPLFLLRFSFEPTAKRREGMTKILAGGTAALSVVIDIAWTEEELLLEEHHQTFEAAVARFDWATISRVIVPVQQAAQRFLTTSKSYFVRLLRDSMDKGRLVTAALMMMALATPNHHLGIVLQPDSFAGFDGKWLSDVVEWIGSQFLSDWIPLCGWMLGCWCCEARSANISSDFVASLIGLSRALVKEMKPQYMTPLSALAQRSLQLLWQRSQVDAEGFSLDLIKSFFCRRELEIASILLHQHKVQYHTTHSDHVVIAEASIALVQNFGNNGPTAATEILKIGTQCPQATDRLWKKLLVHLRSEGQLDNEVLEAAVARHPTSAPIWLIYLRFAKDTYVRLCDSELVQHSGGGVELLIREVRKLCLRAVSEEHCIASPLVWCYWAEHIESETFHSSEHARRLLQEVRVRFAPKPNVRNGKSTVTYDAHYVDEFLKPVLLSQVRVELRHGDASSAQHKIGELMSVLRREKVRNDTLDALFISLLPLPKRLLEVRLLAGNTDATPLHVLQSDKKLKQLHAVKQGTPLEDVCGPQTQIAAALLCCHPHRKFKRAAQLVMNVVQRYPRCGDGYAAMTAMLQRFPADYLPLLFPSASQTSDSSTEEESARLAHAMDDVDFWIEKNKPNSGSLWITAAKEMDASDVTLIGYKRSHKEILRAAARMITFGDE